MMRSIRHILTSNPLRRLHRCRSGTAMTEFAITLPVYVMFMVGIISMYEIHQGAMVSEQRAAAEMWDEALDVQYRNYIPGYEAHPVAAGARAADYYDSADDMDTLAAGLDIGTNLAVILDIGGMYADSGTKAMLANFIDPNAMDLECPDSPKLVLNQIVDGESHTHRLMNDTMDFSSLNSDLGSVMGAASALLDGSGSRPMLAAGIRYGIVGGIDTTEWESGDDVQGRGYQAETLTAYNASAPTRPMERLFQLIFVRMEIGTEDAYADSVAFGLSNIGSGVSDINPCL